MPCPPRREGGPPTEYSPPKGGWGVVGEEFSNIFTASNQTTIPLQAAKNILLLIKKSIVLLLGTGGIVLVNMTIARWLSIVLSSVAVYFLFLYPSFEMGLIYWGL